MEETGWSLVWLPRVTLINQLLAADPGSRDAILLAADEEVVEDALTALSEITDPDLQWLASVVRDEAISSYRDGRYVAAQAAATVVFTALFHGPLGFEKFNTLDDLDPRDGGFREFRLLCILRVFALALKRFDPKDTAAMPKRFNRHASAHRLSQVQYTQLNALVAIMITTSLLRELETQREMPPPPANLN